MQRIKNQGIPFNGLRTKGSHSMSEGANERPRKPQKLSWPTTAGLIRSNIKWMSLRPPWAKSVFRTPPTRNAHFFFYVGPFNLARAFRARGVHKKSVRFVEAKRPWAKTVGQHRLLQDPLLEPPIPRTEGPWVLHGALLAIVNPFTCAMPPQERVPVGRLGRRLGAIGRKWLPLLPPSGSAS